MQKLFSQSSVLLQGRNWSLNRYWFGVSVEDHLGSWWCNISCIFVIWLGSGDEQTADWDHYLGTAGVNLLCQDPCAHWYTASLPFSITDSQWLSPTDFPAILRYESIVRKPRKGSTVLGERLIVSCVLFFHAEKKTTEGLGGSSLHVAVLSGGERQCHQCVVISPSFLMQSVLVSGSWVMDAYHRWCCVLGFS